jgi:hypothetical protein
MSLLKVSEETLKNSQSAHHHEATELTPSDMVLIKLLVMVGMTIIS